MYITRGLHSLWPLDIIPGAQYKPISLSLETLSLLIIDSASQPPIQTADSRRFREGDRALHNQISIETGTYGATNVHSLRRATISRLFFHQYPHGRF